jgi:hypothetical protein
MNTRPVQLLLLLVLIAQMAQAEPAKPKTGTIPLPRASVLKWNDLERLYTPQQLRQAMNLDEDGRPIPVETREPETVVVEGDRGPTRPPPMGFAAIMWGAQHPLQAWRLLTPIPADANFNQ